AQRGEPDAAGSRAGDPYGVDPPGVGERFAGPRIVAGYLAVEELDADPPAQRARTGDAQARAALDVDPPQPPPLRGHDRAPCRVGERPGDRDGLQGPQPAPPPGGQPAPGCDVRPGEV